MKAEHINPFLDATINVFKTLLNIEVRPKEPYLTDVDKDYYRISGLIGLAGDATGNVIISMTAATALKISNKLNRANVKIVDDDVTDALGEFINIIAGNAKKGLSDDQIHVSLPNIVIGNQHKLKPPSNAMSITIPFDGDYGEFNVVVQLKNF